MGHPKYIKLDNHTIKSFEEKLYWLLSEVLQILSYPLETKAKDTKYLYVISYIHIDKIKYVNYLIKHRIFKHLKLKNII